MLSNIRHLYDYCTKKSVTVDSLKVPINSEETSAFSAVPAHWNGRTIIFTHGLGNDKFYPFTETFMDMLDNSYGIFSIDLNGHGTENTHFLSYPEILSTIPSAIDFVGERYKINADNIVLFGHSMGGALCLYESEKHSCAGIITVSTPFKIPDSINNFYESTSIFKTCVARQLKYYNLYDLVPAAYNFKRNIFPCRVNMSGKTYIEVATEILHQVDVLSKIKKPQIPYLQVHGKMDGIISFKQAEQIAEAYGGSKKFICLESGTHFSTLFEKKTRLGIRDWLENLFKQ
ncbi:MAG: alpha/beta fold hydrolase [Fibrobacteria bacterium]|nr:alpha/beta fold hydrolase [Fibrobacteria bacterium]